MRFNRVIIFVILNILCTIGMGRSGIVFTDKLQFYNGPGESFQARETFGKFKFFEILGVEGDWVYARANGNLGYFPIEHVREVASKRKIIGNYANVILLMGPGWEYDTITVVNSPVEVDYIWLENGFGFVQVNGSGVWVYETAIDDIREGQTKTMNPREINFAPEWSDSNIENPDMPIMSVKTGGYVSENPYEQPDFFDSPENEKTADETPGLSNDYNRIKVPEKKTLSTKWKQRQLWFGIGFSFVDIAAVDIPIYKTTQALNRSMSVSYSIDEDKVKNLVPISARAFYLIKKLNIFIDFGGCYCFHPNENIRLLSVEGGSGVCFGLGENAQLDTRIGLGFSNYKRIYKDIENTEYITEEKFPHLRAELGISSKFVLPVRFAFGLLYTEDFDNSELEFSGNITNNLHLYEDDYSIKMKFRGPYIRVELGLIP